MSSGDGNPDGTYPTDQLLDALSDETNRRILASLTKPRTATDVAEDCDIPSSTVYRKLDVLKRAGLVRERNILKPGYGRCNVYERDFEHVGISIEDGGFSVTVDRPSNERDGGLIATDD